MTDPDEVAIARGEDLLPAEEPVVTRAGGDVHIRFPVHVTVVGGLTDADRDLLQDEVFDRLNRALS